MVVSASPLLHRIALGDVDELGRGGLRADVELSQDR
jgi:hypothetical protein